MFGIFDAITKYTYMHKVLVVEDELDIAELLKMHLEDLDCEVTMVHDGLSGLETAQGGALDLIVLDLNLPKLDGLEVCRRLRAANNTTPILMLTARTEEIDKVLGLETGADDYLTKPFSIRELQARVKAILRRSQMLETSATNGAVGIIKYNTLEIDVEKRKVTIKGQRVDLTPKEFDLLHLLAASPGTTYSRARLLSIVWGYEFEGYEHTVNSHINRLRAKVEEDVNNPAYVLTTWGVGYRFADEA